MSVAVEVHLLRYKVYRGKHLSPGSSHCLAVSSAHLTYLGVCAVSHAPAGAHQDVAHVLFTGSDLSLLFVYL